MTKKNTSALFLTVINVFWCLVFWFAQVIFIWRPSILSDRIDDPISHFFVLLSCELLARYYKKFNIPELDHLGHDLEDSALQWKHANNTLHIVVCAHALYLDTKLCLLAMGFGANEKQGHVD